MCSSAAVFQLRYKGCTEWDARRPNLGSDLSMHLWRAVVSFPYRAVCSSALCVGGAPRLQGRLRCVAAAASDWLRSGGVGVGFDLHKRLDAESKSVSGGCRFVEAPHERIGCRELDADSPLVPDNARGRAAQQL